jgi:hypothetical protein
MTRIDRNFITLCWSGIRLRHSDMSASLNTVAGCRDYGIHISGGSFRTTDNHCYGMKYALFLDGASAFNSANDMFADSEYGVYSPGSSNVSSFVNTRIYHNFVRGMWFQGTVNTIVSPQVDVPNSSPPGGVWEDKVGIEFVGASNTIIGGLITLDGVTQTSHGTATAPTAVRVSGSNCRIKDLVINDLDNLNGSRGLNIPTRLIYNFTANAANDRFTSLGHELANNDSVHVSNMGGALPAGLSAGTTYYVVGVQPDTFQLSATMGGAAINITDAGTGTHTVRTRICGGEFEYRIYGFEGSGDAALDVDDAGIAGITVTIVGNSVRSPGFDHTDVNQYIDIPWGWDNSGVNANVFIIKDEATGQSTTVNDGAAH